MRFCAARLPPGTRSAFHAVVLGQARDQPRSLINETLRRAIRFQRTHNLTLAHVPANFSFSLCGARAFSSAAAAAMLIKDAPHAKGKSLAGEYNMYICEAVDGCVHAKIMRGLFYLSFCCQIGVAGYSSLSAAFPAMAHFPEDEK